MDIMNEDFKKLNRMSQSPVHQYKGVWYFWNETWDKRIGSYASKAGAEVGLEVYLQEIEEQKNNDINQLSELHSEYEKSDNDEWDEPYP